MSKDVKIQVICDLAFSKTVKGIEENIKRLIEKANSELFKKGVPKEQIENAAKIVNWELRDNILTLTIVSGTYLRAPTAVLRFRKILAEELGSKFKIGVRTLELKDSKFEIPTENISADTIKKISHVGYIQKAIFHEGKLTVFIQPLGESELKKNVYDRILNLVKSLLEAKIEKTERGAPIVEGGKPKPHRFVEDPVQVGLKMGWIKEFPGRGQWIYTTPYTRLLEAIEGILVETFEKEGFQPFMLPKLIPIEVMQRMPGYLEEIPEGMYYVCPPPRDPEAFTKFKEEIKLTKNVSREMLKKIVKEPDYVLSPAQCEPFWHFFSHETLKIEDLPYKFYDRAGWTYRWEGGGTEGLARLQEFRRVELTYYGTPDQVVQIRGEIVDRLVEIVDKVLELEWRVTAAIPFYMKEGQIIDPKDSKNIAAYDLEIYIPYRGVKEKAEWLEIAGCFIHRDKFVKKFSIHESKNRPLWTGCTGLGISRWVTAFLATHGFNPSMWPNEVKRRFKPYTLPKTLLWPKEASPQ